MQLRKQRVAADGRNNNGSTSDMAIRDKVSATEMDRAVAEDLAAGALIGAADGLKGGFQPARRNKSSDLLFVHVSDEVLFALQLDRKIGCDDVFERALFGLFYLVAFHLLIFLNYRVTRRRDYVMLPRFVQISQTVRDIVSLEWLFGQKSVAI